MAIFARADSEMAAGSDRPACRNTSLRRRTVWSSILSAKRASASCESGKPLGRESTLGPAGRLGTMPARGIPQPGVVSGRRVFVVAPTNHLQIGKAALVTR